MKKIELTIEQLTIIDHILACVEKDYPGTIQGSMCINKADLKVIGRAGDKIKKALAV